jgi:hypothetical protein
MGLAEFAALTANMQFATAIAKGYSEIAYALADEADDRNTILPFPGKALP